MIGRFARDRSPLAALCLSADPTAVTCIANDYGFDEVFARQVRGLGRPGDILVALSTSGRSANIIRALHAARAVGLTTVGLLGPAGSAAEPLCDLVLTAPAMPAAHVQEIHLIAAHLILEYLEAPA
jgi:D-sedoheptulose 7-phosphate isomerase